MSRFELKQTFLFQEIGDRQAEKLLGGSCLAPHVGPCNDTPDTPNNSSPWSPLFTEFGLNDLLNDVEAFSEGKEA